MDYKMYYKWTNEPQAVPQCTTPQITPVARDLSDYKIGGLPRLKWQS